MTGRVFEIREFCLHDGPGIRTTVFLKGCPLRCRWCHNPEGLSFEPEMLRHRDGTQTPCGVDWEPAALAKELLTNSDILTSSTGGITFSGGEPLAQSEFVLAVVAEIRAQTKTSVGVALETSGFAEETVYRQVVSQMDFVYQDVKLPTPEGYAQWCGCTAAAAQRVFRNVAWLKTSGIQYALRVPLIPRVNDDPAMRCALEKVIGDSPVEYLPYNPAAAAKYSMLSLAYDPIPGVCTI